MRRNFRLPEEDERHLNARGLPWEALTEGGANWVLLHEFPVPPGYNYPNVMAAIRIEAAYPPGKLDMVYYFPSLVRAGGQAINGLSDQPLDGKTFQRWSRHYEWLELEHDLSTHISCVEHWLQSELLKR